MTNAKNDNNTNDKLLRKSDLFSMFIRSFFIQAQFALKEKLGTGFGFALIPGIRRISKNKDHAREILLKHSEYFNSHPFLSSYILGAVIRVEEQSIAESSDLNEQISNLKTRMAGVLGSLGDRFFWKFLKPTASLAAFVIILSLENLYPWNVISGLIAFLLINVSFNLYYRMHGIFEGYRSGVMVIKDKKIKLIENLNFKLICLSLLLFGILVIFESRNAFSSGYKAGITLLVSSGATFLLNHKKSTTGISIIAVLTTIFVIFLFWKILSN